MSDFVSSPAQSLILPFFGQQEKEQMVRKVVLLHHSTDKITPEQLQITPTQLEIECDCACNSNK